MSEKCTIGDRFYFVVTCSNGHSLQIPADPKWKLMAITGIRFECLTCGEVVSIPGCFGKHSHDVSCPECRSCVEIDQNL